MAEEATFSYKFIHIYMAPRATRKDNIHSIINQKTLKYNQFIDKSIHIRKKSKTINQNYWNCTEIHLKEILTSHHIQLKTKWIKATDCYYHIATHLYIKEKKVKCIISKRAAKVFNFNIYIIHPTTCFVKFLKLSISSPWAMRNQNGPPLTNNMLDCL